MMTSFEDICLWTSVLVDDCWQRIAPWDRRPGPAPRCSDAELITMALIGECKGWDEETVLLSAWAAQRDLFPVQPSRTRFNRRRQLHGAINQLRRLLTAALDLAADRHGVLDSLPVPVIRFHLVPCGARAYWESYAARFGRAPSTSRPIFGDKRYLLATHTGVMLDFTLASANAGELPVGTELLEVLGDNAVISAPIRAKLAAENRLIVCTLPRANQRIHLSATAARAHNAARQIIEIVNRQLAEPFHLEVNHAQRF